jgi:large subunit ribosomal protein L4
MLEARHFSAAAKPKGSYALPPEFDGKVNEAAIYHAVRAYRANQRQGTHSTLTRGEVSGGNRKPWRQKGTGRARQGSIRAPNWPGGGIAFGPRPRDYHMDLPRKVKRLARQSALNARANEGAMYVVEALEFDRPKTSRMAELVEKLGLSGRKVLVLTAETRPEVYLSGRNIPGVSVLRYADASAYEILWSDAVVVEERAIGGHAVARAATGRTKRVERATSRAAAAKPAAKARKRPAAKPAAKKPARSKPKKKGGDDA